MATLIVVKERFDRLQINRSTLQILSLYATIAIFWVLLALLTPYFLTPQNIGNIFLQSSVMGILAAGLTIVLIGGEIDLSVGTAQALIGTLAAIFIIQNSFPIWVAVTLVLLVSLLIGLINGYFTVFVKIPSFIVTLAMLGITQGLAFVLASGRTIGGFPEAYQQLGKATIGPIPVPVLCFVAIYIIFHLVLTQTRFGLELYAVGGSRTAADRVGLNTRRIITWSFVLSGFLAGIAGLILSARLNAGHGSFGATILLDAVAAVVIGGVSLAGGMGSLIGTFAGVIIISTTRNGLVHLGVDPFWQQVAVGCIIIGAVTLDQLFKGRIVLRDLIPFRRHS